MQGKMKVTDRGTRSEEFEQMLTGAFRQAGLLVKRPVSAVDDGADLVFERDGTKYFVQLKVSSEGRSDRLIPLLSQAILQAHAYAQQRGGATPIAVVAARHIPASVASQVQEFAKRYAPEVGVGVIDAEGLRSFVGFGLEALDAKPSRRQDSEVARTSPARFVFRPQPMDAEGPDRAASSGDAHRGAKRSYPERISARQYSRRVHHERVTICDPVVGAKFPPQ